VEYCQLKCLGRNRFNLVVSPIHPPSRRHQGPFSPLNNRGKPTSFCKKCKTQTNPQNQNAHTTRSRPWWPPAARQSGKAERPRLARGLNAPSGEVRLARGLNAPSGEVRLARGPPRTRQLRSCSDVRAFNALTPQDCATTTTRLGIPPRRCSPTPVVRPSPPLYNTVRRGQCQLCDTVPPTFVRLTRRALEGGTAKPSNRGKCFLYDYTGLHHDVRPAGTVLSVAISPVRPSPPLQHHVGHCDDIPDVVEVHGDRTSP
jgi:hypothetical protein